MNMPRLQLAIGRLKRQKKSYVCDGGIPKNQAETIEDGVCYQALTSIMSLFLRHKTFINISHVGLGSTFENCLSELIFVI